MRIFVQEGFSIRVGCSTKPMQYLFCNHFFYPNAATREVPLFVSIDLLLLAISSSSTLLSSRSCCYLLSCRLVFSCSLLACFLCLRIQIDTKQPLSEPRVSPVVSPAVSQTSMCATEAGPPAIIKIWHCFLFAPHTNQ